MSSSPKSNGISSRLIDYVYLVGIDKNDVSFHDVPFSTYQPQLLKRYPASNHKVISSYMYISLSEQYNSLSFQRSCSKMICSMTLRTFLYLLSVPTFASQTDAKLFRWKRAEIKKWPHSYLPLPIKTQVMTSTKINKLELHSEQKFSF